MSPSGRAAAAESSHTPSSQRFDNRGALSRSLRFFSLGFVLLPTIIWAVFVGLNARTSYFGAQWVPVVVLTVLWFITIGIGYLMTVGRTPVRLMSNSSTTLEVVPWLGRPLRWELDPQGRHRSLERYPASVLSMNPCELIEFELVGSRRHRLIVEEALLDDFLGRGPRGSAQ